jgi:hypothetical protein
MAAHRDRHDPARIDGLTGRIGRPPPAGINRQAGEEARHAGDADRQGDPEPGATPSEEVLTAMGS